MELDAMNNEQLIAVLATRNDLSDAEAVLLDRLMRAMAALKDV